MGKHSSGRPSQATHHAEATVREEIAQGRAARSNAIRATLASLPATKFDEHGAGRQMLYPERLKPWHHLLMIGLLAGRSQTEMAAQLGRSISRISIIVNSPLFASVYNEILRRRYESVVEGEHGVLAQAKTEAPSAMKRMIEMSRTERGGVKLDALKHVLALAGAVPIQKTETVAIDKVLELLDRNELEVFSQTGRFPRRLAEQVASSGRTFEFSDEAEAIDVTPDDDPDDATTVDSDPDDETE